MEVNEITERVIGAAIEVHRETGPGLLESAYERCMVIEMADRSLRFEQQVSIALTYKSVTIDGCYRMDFLVEDTVIVELKAVSKLQPIHTAQMITYLKLTGHRYGLIINFNEQKLVDGVRRIANGWR